MSSMAIRSLASSILALAVTACGANPSEPPATGSVPATTEQTPAASPTAEAAPTADPTAEPTAAPTNSAPTGWEAVIFDRPQTPAGLSGIVQTGDRLVAVGGGAHRGAVWTLDPGGEWEPREGVPATAAESESFGLVDVVDGPQGLVAVGIVGVRNSEASGSAIWTSDDSGETWTEAQRFDGVLLGALAVGDPGVLALGSGASLLPPGAISIWASPNGTDWSQADTEALGTGGIGDAIWRDDHFLAVGHIQGVDQTSNPTPATAAAWTSPDGVTWSEHWTDGRSGTFLEGVAETANGLIAVGVEHSSGPGPDTTLPNMAPRLWQSPDGGRWEMTPIESEPGQILSFAASETGFAAVGFLARDPQQALGLWTSPDGMTWTLVSEVADESQGALRAAVVLRDRIVAVGGTQGESEEDSHPIVVTGPLPQVGRGP